ncbi:hypothetical protein B1M_42993 [Burkholderia sp. TJI49]|nr:hypothetical protein B1M_42993 [Burkholderia sp. TJI49]
MFKQTTILVRYDVFAEPRIEPAHPRRRKPFEQTLNTLPTTANLGLRSRFSIRHGPGLGRLKCGHAPVERIN